MKPSTLPPFSRAKMPTEAQLATRVVTGLSGHLTATGGSECMWKVALLPVLKHVWCARVWVPYLPTEHEDTGVMGASGKEC